jgi:bacteriocin-like protein
MSHKTNPKSAKGMKKQEAPREAEASKVRATSSDRGELSDEELETVTGGKATAKGVLMKSCATGKHFNEGTISL